MPRLLRHPLFALAVLVAFVFSQGTWALAGTTGTLTGVVSDSGTNTPLSGAKITVVSPSQSATTTTSATGSFTFVSLNPDTYTVAVEKAGYEPTSLSGVSIFADQSQNLTLSTRKTLTVIGRVTSRSSSDLIKPGTTVDIYSVDSRGAQAAASLGGGGGLNNAYSAIASVPGVFVPIGQKGEYQSVFVRGGSYTQLGYEYDGVPIQRAFDQYPGGSLSNLGQQELQVYTGTAPINTGSTALAGFINQVIKSGTYPGFGTVQFGAGAPSFYHQALVEWGGATPNRNFSYYIGASGYNQTFTYERNSQFQGWGTPVSLLRQNCTGNNPTVGCYANNSGAYGAFSPLGPNGFNQAPVFVGASKDIADRELTANVKLGLPHKSDSGKDEIQVLYNVNYVPTYFSLSQSDIGSYLVDLQTGSMTNNGYNYPACPTVSSGNNCGITLYGGPGPAPNFRDKNLYFGPTGQVLTAANLGQIQFSPFPNSPTARAANAQIDPLERDSYQQNGAIFKLQYQKNFGSKAFARIFGYTEYSDWLQYAPNAADYGSQLGGISSDYKLGSHTRGVGFNFTSQLNDQHLFNFDAAYTTSNTFRFNNAAIGLSNSVTSAASNNVAFMVNSANPSAGICYAAPAAGTVATAVNCSAGSAAKYRIPGVTAAPVLFTANATDPTVATVGNFTCGGAPCTYFTVGNGQAATYNTVVPQFLSLAIQDTWRPTSRLTINLGLRYDDFKYRLPSTTGGPDRAFWVNYYNNNFCYDSSKIAIVAAASPQTCATPATQSLLQFSAVSPSANDYPELQPRLGFTYTLNPLNVIRASAGKTAQPASSAFQQYNTLQPNIFTGTNQLFYPLGFHSPNHTVYPEESFNYDLSWEHQQANSDLSWKLTPYIRTTKNELSTVLLDPVTNFVSSINVGKKNVKGLEFLIRKGRLDRDGLYGQIAYTYTWARETFTPLPSGLSVVDALNTSTIKTYNAYTSFCTNNPTDKRCAGGTTSAGVAGAPCYVTAAGTTRPDPTCSAAGTVANPYWNAPPQALFDPNGNYAPYNTLSGSTFLSGSNQSYIVPHVVAAILNWKRDRFNFTPSLQFQGGGMYGRPTQVTSVDPAAGCAALAGASTVGDPRYPNGAAGGAPYNAATCASGIVAPDPITGSFDNYGSFREPNVLTLNLGFSYDLSAKTSVALQLVNVATSCWGGSTVPWQQNGRIGCNYGPGGTYVSNFYNPGDTIAPYVKYPYNPNFGSVFQSTSGAQGNPFQMFLTMTFKL